MVGQDNFYTKARVLIAASVLPLVFVTPRQLSAQELAFLSSLFKDVNSITLYGEFAEIRKSPQLGTGGSRCLFLSVCGAGAEILWDLTPAANAVHVELGFGAEYLRGFTGKPLADPFDLHASVKSFPQFGAYLSGPLFGNDWLIPYAGGTFGVSELWYAQAYGADQKQVSIKSQTFDYGLVGGLGLSAGWSGNAFVEVGWRARRFPGLEYQSKDPLPASWPREFDLSGW